MCICFSIEFLVIFIIWFIIKNIKKSLQQFGKHYITITFENRIPNKHKYSKGDIGTVFVKHTNYGLFYIFL